MFDSASVKSAEFLSLFGKNTCVTLTHNYGANAVQIRSARTNNVIWECEDINSIDIHAAAVEIMGMKKFPKNRKMNKAWSPIRLTAKAQADAEITKATAIYWG